MISNWYPLRGPGSCRMPLTRMRIKCPAVAQMLRSPSIRGIRSSCNRKGNLLDPDCMRSEPIFTVRALDSSSDCQCQPGRPLTFDHVAAHANTKEFGKLALRHPCNSEVAMIIKNLTPFHLFSDALQVFVIMRIG